MITNDEIREGHESTGNLDLFKMGLDNGQFPKYLYKYRSIKDAVLTLINNKIRFTSAYGFDFTDVLDSKANWIVHNDFFNWYKWLLSKNVTAPIALEKAVKVSSNYITEYRIIQENIDDVYKNTGVLCLCRTNDNVHMWNVFADQLKGVCLEFDISKDLKTFYFPKAIQYGGPLPTINYIVEERRCIEPLFHKDIIKKKEDEFRIVKPFGEEFRSFNKQSLTGIILGPNISQTDEKLIRNAASSYPNVIIKRATLNGSMINII